MFTEPFVKRILRIICLRLAAMGVAPMTNCQYQICLQVDITTKALIQSHQTDMLTIPWESEKGTQSSVGVRLE
jgi:hypothetical protein